MKTIRAHFFLGTARDITYRLAPTPTNISTTNSEPEIEKKNPCSPRGFGQGEFCRCLERTTNKHFCESWPTLCEAIGVLEENQRLSELELGPLQCRPHPRYWVWGSSEPGPALAKLIAGLPPPPWASDATGREPQPRGAAGRAGCGWPVQAPADGLVDGRISRLLSGALSQSLSGARLRRPGCLVFKPWGRSRPGGTRPGDLLSLNGLDEACSAG